MPTPTLHVPRWRLPWPVRVLAACVVAWIGAMSVVWLVGGHVWNWCMDLWETVGLIDMSAPPGITRKVAMLTEAIDVAVHGLPGALAGLYTYHRLSFRRYRDEHTRCGACGYIVKALTEPRCPECGEGI